MATRHKTLGYLRTTLEAMPTSSVRNLTTRYGEVRVTCARAFAVGLLTEWECVAFLAEARRLLEAHPDVQDFYADLGFPVRP